MFKLSRLLSAPFGDSAIGKIHFLTSYVWRVWDCSLHFFDLLMCAALIYWDLRQFRFCRHLCRGCSSPEDLQYSGYYQKMDRDRYVLLTDTFKRITHAGSMMRFPVHKGYYGKPTHHTGVSYLKRLLISKLLNPRPAALPAKTLWA